MSKRDHVETCPYTKLCFVFPHGEGEFTAAPSSVHTLFEDVQLDQIVLFQGQRLYFKAPTAVEDLKRAWVTSIKIGAREQLFTEMAIRANLCNPPWDLKMSVGHPRDFRATIRRQAPVHVILIIEGASVLKPRDVQSGF